MDSRVRSLLDIVYDQASITPNDKRAAEAELAAFARSHEGLQWALTISNGHAGSNPQSQFFAATVLEVWVATKWHLLQPEQRSALTQSLWQYASSSLASQPKFVTRKMASVLAHLVCLEWPHEFWSGVQDCLADPSRVETGLVLLDATMEQLQSLAPTTQAGLRGKVLSSQQPLIKERLAQAQPLAMSILYNIAASPNSVQDPEARAFALQIFRKVLSDTPGLGTDPDLALKLVCALAGIVRGSLTDSNTHQNTAVAAMACLTEVYTKLRGTPALAQTIDKACEEMGGILAWLPSMAQTPDVDFKLAYVRLVVSFTSLALACSGASMTAAHTTVKLLQRAEQFTAASRLPLDLLMLTELWHAVLGHMEDLEDQSWSYQEDSSVAPPSPAVDILPTLKTSTLAVVHIMMLTLYETSQGDIALNTLDVSPGSGSTMEDTMLSLASGEDEAAEEAAIFAAQDDGDGFKDQATALGDSELGVYLRYCEIFFARAIGTFGKELVPIVRQRFESQAASAVDHLQQWRHAIHAGAPPGAAAPGLLMLFVRVDIALKCLSRCGHSLIHGGESVSQLGATADTINGIILLTQCWVELAQLAAGAFGHQALASTALKQLGCQLFSTLSAITSSWLPTLLLSPLMQEEGTEAGVIAIACDEISSAAGVLEALCAPPLATWSVGRAAVALAAAQQLLSLSSIALSSSMKPSEHTLSQVINSEGFGKFASLCAVALNQPTMLPAKATKALWVTFSDLVLRSWSQHFKKEEVLHLREAHVGAMMHPLEAVFAAPLHVEHLSKLHLACNVLHDILQTYSGSLKVVRGVVYRALLAPMLPHLLHLLPALVAFTGPHRQEAQKATASLIRILSAALQVLSTEITASDLEQLLDLLFQTFTASGPAGGSDGFFEVEMQLATLLTGLLNQGGNKHKGQVPKAVHFCVYCWQKIAAASVDGSLLHAKAHFLASGLSLLHHHWRSLSNDPVVMQVLGMLDAYFSAAGKESQVLPAADVRLVLEELYDLHVTSRLYGLSMFQALRHSLLDSLLLMLLARLHTAAQESIMDTVFALAAANWSDFLLTFVPNFIEQRLAALGPVKNTLVDVLGVGDMSANAFDRRLLAFLNDATYYQRQL